MNFQFFLRPKSEYGVVSKQWRLSQAKYHVEKRRKRLDPKAIERFSFIISNIERNSNKQLNKMAVAGALFIYFKIVYATKCELKL